VGAQNPGPRAIDMLSLDRPNIDWCEMARAHGVPGVRAETCEALEDALAQAADAPGPHLIEVAL
jgi:acetolactate synthase-1/2/3 large subunit